MDIQLFRKAGGSFPALADFLEIENCDEIQRPQCPQTGIPLWSQLRIAFFRTIMGDLFYNTPMPTRSGTTSSRRRAVMTMTRSMLRNRRFMPALRSRAPILLTGEGVADRWAGAGWHNRLVDPFIERTPDRAAVLLDHSEWRWPFPRSHERVLLHAPFQARHALFGKRMAWRHRQSSADLVRIAVDRARARLGWEIGPKREADLTQFLARKAAALPVQFSDYGGLLDHLGTRLLLVGCGCYGPSAALIAAARERGIVTAEYAHAGTTAGHDAYNFAAAVRESASYRRILPDYLLNYGEWWDEQVNAPVARFPIGNPARPPLEPAVHNDQDVILILGDGIEFDNYIQIAHHIRGRVSSLGCRVVLRPHPMERDLVLRRYGKRAGDVVIDAEGTIYQAFASAKAVLSEVSTGLFEACGLVEHIWVLETPKSRFSVPHHPFVSISSLEELDRVVDGVDRVAAPTVVPTSLWKRGWAQNYAGFLNDVGALR